MSRGIVFDVREFTVHDGPGIRTTVFMKGCPLRCTWCHNPEGLDMAPSVMRSPAGERTVGRSYEAAELAAILSRQASILAMNGGGVTFSGGEPLMQAGFVAEVIDLLPGMHVVLDTSGLRRAGRLPRRREPGATSCSSTSSSSMRKRIDAGRARTTARY